MSNLEPVQSESVAWTTLPRPRRGAGRILCVLGSRSTFGGDDPPHLDDQIEPIRIRGGSVRQTEVNMAPALSGRAL